ncbi:MAG: GGDEF domain-containing protein [Lachnospiraceae bacterium]|nr:GGDEF domain-containing protein [Lachnospiraceae bacterium]
MKQIEHAKTKLYIWIFAAAVAVFTIMTVWYLFIVCEYEDVRLSFGDNYGEETEWTLNATSVELPQKIKGTANSTIVLTGSVPEYINDDWGMMIYASYAKCQVQVDNETIYSFGYSDPLPFGKMLGNIRLIIPLKESMAGKNITIYVQPCYTMNMDINRPEFGTVDQLKSSVLRGNMLRMFMVGVVVLLFITSLVILMVQLKNRRADDVELVLHFISFMILAMTWIVCSSDIPQFLTDAYAPVSFLSFVSLAGLGVPFVGMCKVLFTKGKRVMEFLWVVGLLIPLVNILCYIWGICDPIVLLPVTHVYLIVVAALTFIYVLLQRKDSSSMMMVVGMLAIIFAAAAGLILFYIAPSKNYAPSAFAIGFVVFFGFMVQILVKRRIEQIKEYKFIDTYKSLAYSDVMTGLENRTSFEARFSSMQSENMQGKMVTVILFDIDGIKEINDSIGHQAGDKMITGTAEIINKAFSNAGRCYRIGGDEFAVIMVDKPLLADKFLEEFDEMLEEYNKYNAFAIKVSYGYAQKEWSDDPVFFRELFKSADKAMYSSKQGNSKA